MKMGHYKPLEENSWRSEISDFGLLVGDFLNRNGYDTDKIGIVETSVYQIITKVHQRKQYFEYFHRLNMSDFKELALRCFWIIKTKPLYFKSDTLTADNLTFESINEKFAVFYIIKKFKALTKSDAVREKIDCFFSEQYVYELVYSFTYRDISKEAMILIVETIAIALGFKAYKG